MGEASRQRAQVDPSTVRLARALVRQARKQGEYEEDEIERVAKMPLYEDNPKKVHASE